MAVATNKGINKNLKLKQPINSGMTQIKVI